VLSEGRGCGGGRGQHWVLGGAIGGWSRAWAVGLRCHEREGRELREGRGLGWKGSRARGEGRASDGRSLGSLTRDALRGRGQSWGRAGATAGGGASDVQWAWSL
jgi:hypothetical protein